MTKLSPSVRMALVQNMYFMLYFSDNLEQIKFFPVQECSILLCFVQIFKRMWLNNVGSKGNTHIFILESNSS